MYVFIYSLYSSIFIQVRINLYVCECMCACLRLCACVRVRARLHVCERASERESERVRPRVCFVYVCVCASGRVCVIFPSHLFFFTFVCLLNVTVEGTNIFVQQNVIILLYAFHVHEVSSVVKKLI